MNRLLPKILLFSILCLPFHLHSEDTPAVREHQVKAMFLFNFTKFVTWPDKTFASTTTPISICILGEDPFLGKLNDIVKDHSVQGRSLEIHYYQAVEKTKDCHIVFVNYSEQNRLTSIHNFLKEYPVFTVSDTKDFVRNGGMVEFYTLESKVRFFIDIQTVNEAGLKVSSRLLQVATIFGK